MRLTEIPDWITFPEKEWAQISPSEAGLDPRKFDAFLGKLNLQGMDYGGDIHNGNNWGLVLTRGGYLVQTWGNGDYKYQTASTGKAFIYALLGLAVQEGLVQADDLVNDTWTGEGQLSHTHKYLDQGHHRTLTWRHLVGIKWEGGHYGGFPIEIGYFWKMGRDSTPIEFRHMVPEWSNWTGDPFHDIYSHIEPGSRRHYSSAGTWRVAQALTYLWDRDLKDVLDEKIMSKIGIAADDWEWMIGRDVQQDRDFYPAMPNSWDYLDPPYQINGHPVRSGPGWAVMNAKDLARFGLLVATGGNWKGEQLIDAAWTRTHSGGNGSGLHGESRYYTSMGRVTMEGIDMQFGVDRDSLVPKDIFVGPVKVNKEI